MATYAIGDLQGCLTAFKHLLEKIAFEPEKDSLWLTGDLVNRGPESLATLRHVYALRDRVVVVLGNHDLHLLAIEAGCKKPSSSDTLNDVLNAPDKDVLLTWLSTRPLLHHDPLLNYTMVHAGIPPQWSLEEAKKRAKEVENVLQSDQRNNFLCAMYGNTPHGWQKTMTNIERWRVITNYLTRMRFCNEQGQLELTHKAGIHNRPEGYAPWFEHLDRQTREDQIVFGHWAALKGQATSKNIYALDTGCVWGGCLTAMRLEDKKRFSITCKDLKIQRKH